MILGAFFTGKKRDGHGWNSFEHSSVQSQLMRICPVTTKFETKGNKDMDMDAGNSR